jgi:hypothetical protein
LREKRPYNLGAGTSRKQLNLTWTELENNVKTDVTSPPKESVETSLKILEVVDCFRRLLVTYNFTCFVWL